MKLLTFHRSRSAPIAAVMVSLMGCYFAAIAQSPEEICGILLAHDDKIDTLTADISTTVEFPSQLELMSPTQAEQTITQIFEQTGIPLLVELLQDMDPEELGKFGLSKVLENTTAADFDQGALEIANAIVTALTQKVSADIVSTLRFDSPDRVRLESIQNWATDQINQPDGPVIESLVADGCRLSISSDAHEPIVQPLATQLGDAGVTYQRYETSALNYIAILSSITEATDNLIVVGVESLRGRSTVVLEGDVPEFLINPNVSVVDQPDIIKYWIDVERAVALRIQLLKNGRTEPVISSTDLFDFEDVVSDLWLATRVETVFLAALGQTVASMTAILDNVSINPNLPTDTFEIQGTTVVTCSQITETVIDQVCNVESPVPSLNEFKNLMEQITVNVLSTIDVCDDGTLGSGINAECLERMIEIIDQIVDEAQQ